MTYISCSFVENIPGESITMKVSSKLNGTLGFLHTKRNRFLPQPFCMLLCKAVIQPHVQLGILNTPKQMYTLLPESE